MTKEDEKAEWRKRQKIKPQPPRVLHVSKQFTVVKTDTLPVTQFARGRTYERLDTIEQRRARQIERQQAYDRKMAAKADKTIAHMDAVTKAATQEVADG